MVHSDLLAGFPLFRDVSPAVLEKIASISEELGFAERGQGGEMFLRGDTWPGGKIPTTTNGGMLSQGHTGAGGSCAIMVETVRQLMGKAGDRQVKNAKYAAETAVGGTYMDAHVTILGTEIP